MRALIFANGDLNPGPMVDAALAAAPGALIIAADGGARHAEHLGLIPDAIVGDMDSLAEDDLLRYRKQGASVLRHPPAKNETDLELALIHAAEQGATWGRVIGAVGDRLDQTIGNVMLLTLPQLERRDFRLVAGRQEIGLLTPGEHTFQGSAGDTLSLLPFMGDAIGVATQRLVYPLRGEPLFFGPARGMSNVFESETAQVRLEAGLLLAIHTLGRA